MNCASEASEEDDELGVIVEAGEAQIGEGAGEHTEDGRGEIEAADTGDVHEAPPRGDAAARWLYPTGMPGAREKDIAADGDMTADGRIRD